MKKNLGKIVRNSVSAGAIALFAAAMLGVPAFGGPGQDPRSQGRNPARTSPARGPQQPARTPARTPTPDPAGPRVVVPAVVVAPAPKRVYLIDDLKLAMYAEPLDLARIELILRTGIVPDVECMTFAVRMNSPKLLELFLLAGGDPNALFSPGMPLLGVCHYANGDIACAKLLIDFGARTEFSAGFAGGRPAPYRAYLETRRANELLAYIRASEARPHRTPGFAAVAAAADAADAADDAADAADDADDAAKKADKAAKKADKAAKKADKAAKKADKAAKKAAKAERLAKEAEEAAAAAAAAKAAADAAAEEAEEAEEEADEAEEAEGADEADEKAAAAESADAADEADDEEE